MSDLLDTAIAAHGGAETWRTVDTLRFRLRVRGNILMLRGRSPRTRALTASLAAHRVHARLDPFPGPGRVGVLDGDEVWIEDADGTVLQRRPRTPAGQRQGRLWDALDELNFLAYAFWNYGTTPFLLARPEIATRELPPVDGPGGPLRRLVATFPPSIPTHSREQTFSFGPDGLLRRLDYTADVFGPIAHGAHFCHAPRAFDGLVVPTHRRVVPYALRRFPNRAPAAMEGWIDDVAVERRHG
ncbi:hypothetical protein [Rubrivirga sp. IMCC43871]|uniref:hypothetical protein n=1 Tax=Rubrivirga sp. IMCC43871 TaxID=3391575 RepID=UPI0039901AB5